MGKAKPDKNVSDSICKTTHRRANLTIAEKLDLIGGIEDSLLNRISGELDELGPSVLTDTLNRLSMVHERFLNIEKMHRENMESVTGTTRRIVFDWTITPPREPGNPDEPNA